jgi:hypothetical protein
MSRDLLPAETILRLLDFTPRRLAELTEHTSPQLLDQEPAASEWSASQVLAHLRACADVWGERYMLPILSQEHPTIKAINPRTWILSTHYLELEFQPSLLAFTEQRARLLSVLSALSPQDWQRGNTLLGAGKPLQQTLQLHADRMARHDRVHLKQIEQTLKSLQSTYN